MTIKDLRVIVADYLEELSYNHPFVTSDKFEDNSYAKWACKELLHEIDKAERAPFDLVPQQILEQFREKMNRYAYMNSKASLGFVIASETAEYLIEQ